MTYLVLVLLGLWLIASAANQIAGPWTRLLRPLNDYSLLPRLDFFAPDPSDVDYHLAFRDFADDQQAGPWQQIGGVTKNALRILWCPSKRDHEATMTAVSGLAHLQGSVVPLAHDPEGLLQVSLPYLFLLHRALQAPRGAGARSRQFMIVETSGFGSDRRVALGILSNPHRFD